MKKNIFKISTFVLSFILLLGITLIGISAVENIIEKDDGEISFATDYVAGDANSDGKADIRDLVRLNLYLNKTEYNINKLAANTNGDIDLDAEDLASLRQIILGTES